MKNADIVCYLLTPVRNELTYVLDHYSVVLQQLLNYERVVYHRQYHVGGGVNFVWEPQNLNGISISKILVRKGIELFIPIADYVTYVLQHV